MRRSVSSPLVSGEAMNTPPSKSPKRFKEARLDAKRLLPSGSYHLGAHHADYAQVLGLIASTFPHLEDSMIGVFAFLLDPKSNSSGVAKEIFRTVVNQQIRIQIMQTFLEKSPRHAKTPTHYDEIIDEFSKLNGLRNIYLHGLWTTHDTGDTFFTETSAEIFGELYPRKVDIKELLGVLDRMRILQIKASLHDHPERWGSLLTPTPHLPPLDEQTS